MNAVEASFLESEYLDYEMVEIDYCFWGDVCVVPYIVRARGLTSAGEAFERKLRSVAVYKVVDGVWCQVASETSILPDGGGAVVGGG